jgi:hypothetical protein
MSHIDDAVITPGTGFIFVAPTGTARPEEALIESYQPMNDGHFPGYVSLGHTSRDDLPSFGFDGGDTEVQGTWSNATFREVVTEAPADYVTFNALQFDEQVLGLYYGVEDPSLNDGVFEVQQAPTTTVPRALLVVVVDGPRRVAFHAASTSIRREDAVELEVDAFAAFPLRATFLKMQGQPIYSWVGVAAGDVVS